MGEKENNNNLNEFPVTRWLRNAVLGATMADLPAMMTASGWRQDEKGDYVQDQQNDPHVKLLRDNLAAEGMGVMLGEFGIPAIYGLYNLGVRGLGRAGNNWARAKLINREMQNAATPNHTYPLNVGWGPKQTIKVVHASDSEDPLQLFFDKRWDVTKEGANPFGVWYLGKWGLPRTAATNSLPGKAEKAAKAREVFENRKYKHEGEVTLDKPLTTVGEVPDRSILSYDAEKMGADGIIYNNVYDNGYDNNQVILSLKLHQTIHDYFKDELGRRHLTVKDFAETIPESENLKAIMLSPNFTPASKVSNIKIGNKEGYYLGDIKFGNIGEQYGEEIIRRLQNLGHDTSLLMPMKIANNTIVGSPQGLIRKLVKEPIQVYSAKTSTTSVGSYDPTTGKAYLRVTNRPTSKHASTAHHEGIMHRTDDIINQATEGKVPAMYLELTNLMDDTGLLRTEGSNKWYELRATLGLAIRDAYIRGARLRNIKLSDFLFGTVRDAFNKSVDMLDAGELARVLRDINAYGEDYANVLGMYPLYLDKFKHLLKYAPSIIGVSNIIENE